jgi:hypothetical protein
VLIYSNILLSTCQFRDPQMKCYGHDANKNTFALVCIRIPGLLCWDEWEVTCGIETVSDGSTEFPSWFPS